MNFILPLNDNHLELNTIQLHITDDKNNLTFINHSLQFYLNQIKCMIENEKEWSNMKLLTNPYEFIHTSYDGIHSISAFNPVSRSFYKLIEINKMFNLVENREKCISMHLAEGPGGFIQALRYIRNNNKNDICIGITLHSSKDSIPNWNKLKQKNDSSILFDSLYDKTGDLYSYKNIEYLYTKYKHSIHFITADGGFDFSSDYENQENSILRLLIIQMISALLCQSKNGCFVLKMFDIFCKSSIDILYILNTFYEEVHICKPVTSRVANSEKYIVCKQFRYTELNTDTVNKLLSIIKKMHENPDKLIVRILSFDIHDIFVHRVEEINSMLGQRQIENINNTIQMIEQSSKGEFIETNKNNNLHKCILWCIEHDVEYNPIQKLNTFNKKYTNILT